MNNYKYYQKLKKLSQIGRLSIYLIIAPPRTNSSMVEHALGNSPDVQHECHEPFLKARHDDFDPDHGYSQIYESIGGEQFESSDTKTSVVVKEMSHWIGKNDEYKRLATMVTGPIVVLIRNPLLAVESRIRRVLTTIDMRYSIDIQRFLLDEAAVEKGYKNWADLIQRTADDTHSQKFEFVLNGEGIERLYDTPILTVQNRLLDLTAHKYGYTNWRDLVEKKLYADRDYAFFGGILSATARRVKFERMEFRVLAEEVAYFEKSKQDYIVFDTTDVRAKPTEYLNELCRRLGIRFSPKMLQWGRDSVDFHTEQEKQSEKLWYDRLFSSYGVNAPTEIPPTLSKFPAFMQEYLRDDNLPTYAKLSQCKVSSENDTSALNDLTFEVRITSENIEQLHTLELIKKDTAVGDVVSLSLEHIDPVYAVTNEPGLVDAPEFCRCKDWYAEELRIVSKVLRTDVR